MRGHREVTLCTVIVLLALGLYASGRTILSDAGPLNGYQRLEGLVGILASVAGMVLAVWWVIALAMAFASELLRRAGHRNAALVTGMLAPSFLKRLAAAVLGLQLVSGLPTVTAAGHSTDHGHGIMHPAGATAPQLEASSPDPAQDAVITPLWKPHPAPVDTGPLARGQTRAPGPPPSGNRSTEVVVHPGDSLWTIAAHHLGPFATEVEVAEEWPRWHHQNREVIGDDPHLLLPGQVLRAPHDPR